MQKKKTSSQTKSPSKAASKAVAARAAAMARRAEESRQEAHRQLDERYRPVLERFAATDLPTLADSKAVVGKLLDGLASAIPHYRYHAGEDDVFLLFLRDVLRGKVPRKAVAPAEKRTRPSAGASSKKGASGKPGGTIRDGDFSWTGFSEDEVEEAKRALAIWRAQWDVHVAKTQIALLELDDATRHRQTWEAFSRIALGGERPKQVAAAMGKSLYTVYQLKKRMTDRLKAIVARLSALQSAPSGNFFEKES